MSLFLQNNDLQAYTSFTRDISLHALHTMNDYSLHMKLMLPFISSSGALARWFTIAPASLGSIPRHSRYGAGRSHFAACELTRTCSERRSEWVWALWKERDAINPPAPSFAPLYMDAFVLY